MMNIILHPCNGTYKHRDTQSKLVFSGVLPPPGFRRMPVQRHLKGMLLLGLSLTTQAGSLDCSYSPFKCCSRN